MESKNQEVPSTAISSVGVEETEQSSSPQSQMTAIATNPVLAAAIKGLIEQVIEDRDKRIKELENQVTNLDIRNSKQVFEAVRDKHMKMIEIQLENIEARLNNIETEVYNNIPSTLTTHKDEEMILSLQDQGT